MWSSNTQVGIIFPNTNSNSEQVDPSVCGQYMVSKGGWYVVGLCSVRGQYVVGKPDQLVHYYQCKHPWKTGPINDCTYAFLSGMNYGV